MPIPLLAAAIPAVLGATKAGAGFIQKQKGFNILKNTERPTYEIPEEVFSNLTQAQLTALEGLPDEQKEQYLRNIDRGTSTALSASASRKGGLSIVDDILRNNTDAYSNLLTQDSVQRLNNRRDVLAQRQNLANYRDKAFEFNQVQPYHQRLNAGQALIGSGLQNIYGGAQDVGGAALQYLNSRPNNAPSQINSPAAGFSSDGFSGQDQDFYNQFINQLNANSDPNAIHNQSQYRLDRQ